jgi:hypothetical protein
MAMCVGKWALECVCMCVCDRKKEREGDRDVGKDMCVRRDMDI